MENVRTAAYLNPCPSSTHVYARNAQGEKLDSFSGPRDFMARYYLSSGYRVFDVDGRELTREAV